MYQAYPGQFADAWSMYIFLPAHQPDDPHAHLNFVSFRSQQRKTK
jgi:hypothetical protein